MQIINGLIQVFMGAVSGYYTNKLAISHLFTDIPLLGGISWKAVIKKGGNKERLAEDLSEIAEDKIIGKQSKEEGINKKDSYLYKELSKADVINTLDQCVEDIFQELEQSKTGQRKLLEIIENFLNQDTLYQLLKQSLFTAAADWKLEDLITEEVFLSFCEELWKKGIAPKLQGEYGLEAFIEGFLKELSDGREIVTLETILGQEICEQIEEVLTKKIIEIFNAMEKDSERLKMEGYLHSLCRQFGIGTIVRNFFVSLREKKLGDLLSIEDESWFCEKLSFILENPNIQKGLQELFEILIQKLAEADITLSDLLPQDCLESEDMAEVLAKQIRNLQPFVSDLYENNREFISERLTQELSTAIHEGTGNFLQNMVLLSAKDVILEKMQKFLQEKMPEKIQEFLESPSKEVCLGLCHTIGQLKPAGLIDKISFDMVFFYLKKELTHNRYLLEKINHISLSLFLSDDIIDYLSKKADTFLLEAVSEWLKGQEKEEQVKKAVPFLFQKLSKKPFREQEAERLLKEIKKSSLPKRLLEWLNNQFVLSIKADEEEISKERKERKTIFQQIYRNFSSIYLKDLLEEKIFAKTEKSLFYQLLEKTIVRYKDKLTVATAISSIPKESIKKKIRELFTEKAADYISVKPIVKEKVLALDEDKLCTMMQKFMGTQLRPLNRIGGALGAIVGLLIWLVNPSMERNLFMLISMISCYALIGIGTNVLALHGLFRPYHIKERKWLGRFAEKDDIMAKAVISIYRFLSKIPGIRNIVCLGYIPEKKNKIAGQLANFVADNFLNPEDLLPEIKLNPEMVQKFLKDHGNTIAEQAVEKLQNMDWENIVKIFILTANTKKSNLLPMDISFLSEIIYPKLEKVQEKPIENYIDAEQAAEKITKFLQEQIENAGEKQIEIINSMQGWYKKTLQKRTVKELLLEKQEVIIDHAEEKFFLFLFSEDFLKKIEDFILRELSIRAKQDKRCITSFFGGKLEDILDKNLDALKLFLFHVLKKECYQYLFNHEEELVDKLDLEIQNMMNTMADGMPLGGVASSMLGTKQLIGKAFHRIFIEPQCQEVQTQEEPLWNEQKNEEETKDRFYGTKEVIAQERLSDELFDKNEERLLKKIEEILQTQVFTLTIGDLEEIFFALDSNRNRKPEDRERKEAEDENRNQNINGNEYKNESLEEIIRGKQQAREQWVRHLCTTGFFVISQNKAELIKPMQDILNSLFVIAGERTIGEYTSLIHKDFLKNTISIEVFGEVLEAMQKPSVELACKDCLKYIITSYLISDHCGRYFSLITKDSLAVILQKNWKIWSHFSCINTFLLEVLTLDFPKYYQNSCYESCNESILQDNSLLILIRELVISLKEKDSIWEGCQRFLCEGIEIISELLYKQQDTKDNNTNNSLQNSSLQDENCLQDIFQEMLDCINEAFQYKKEHQTTLISVAEKIDFANIIYLAVMDMTDVQIEELFKGFAGSYFLSLKLSGALGFVFGVPVVKWVAVIIALSSELIRKDKID